MNSITNKKVTYKYFVLQLKQAEPITVWIAVSEDSVTLLELQTMAVMCRYNYGNIVTFGGCLDDFMLVACPDEGAAEQKLLFALSKPKVREYQYLLKNNEHINTHWKVINMHNVSIRTNDSC